ncbi:unnamed protein product [Amoebophrya sp. A120]|nr:unnamed protein product [Amoebophrya sp. A120]|eukprot:GSA120T00022930001.1
MAPLVRVLLFSARTSRAATGICFPLFLYLAAQQLQPLWAVSLVRRREGNDKANTRRQRTITGFAVDDGDDLRPGPRGRAEDEARAEGVLPGVPADFLAQTAVSSGGGQEHAARGPSGTTGKGDHSTGADAPASTPGSSGSDDPAKQLVVPERPPSLFSEELERMTEIKFRVRAGAAATGDSSIHAGGAGGVEDDMRYFIALSAGGKPRDVEEVANERTGRTSETTTTQTALTSFVQHTFRNLKKTFHPAALPLVALPLGTSVLRWAFADREAWFREAAGEAGAQDMYNSADPDAFITMPVEPRVAVRTTLDQRDFPEIIRDPRESASKAVQNIVGEGDGHGHGNNSKPHYKLYPVPLPRMPSNTTSQDVKLSSFFARSAQAVVEDYALAYLRLIFERRQLGADTHTDQRHHFNSTSVQHGSTSAGDQEHAGQHAGRSTSAVAQHLPASSTEDDSPAALKLRLQGRPAHEGSFRNCRLSLRTSPRGDSNSLLEQRTDTTTQANNSESRSTDFAGAGRQDEVVVASGRGTVTLIEKQEPPSQEEFRRRNGSGLIAASSSPTGASTSSAPTASPAHPCFGDLALADLLDEVPEEVWEQQDAATRLTPEEPDLVLVKLSLAFEYDTAIEIWKQEGDDKSADEQSRTLVAGNNKLLTFDVSTSFDLLLFRGPKLRARQLAVESRSARENRDHRLAATYFLDYEDANSEEAVTNLVDWQKSLNFPAEANGAGPPQGTSIAAVRWAVNTSHQFEDWLLHSVDLAHTEGHSLLYRRYFLWYLARKSPSFFEFSGSDLRYRFLLYRHFDFRYFQDVPKRGDAPALMLEEDAALVVEPSMWQDTFVLLQILSSPKNSHGLVETRAAEHWSHWFCPRTEPGAKRTLESDLMSNALRGALAGTYFLRGRRRFLDFMAALLYTVSPWDALARSRLVDLLKRCLLLAPDADAVVVRSDKLQATAGDTLRSTADKLRKIGDKLGVTPRWWDVVPAPEPSLFPGKHCDPPLDRIQVRLAALRRGTTFASNGTNDYYTRPGAGQYENRITNPSSASFSELLRVGLPEDLLQKYRHELDSEAPGAVSPTGGRKPLGFSEMAYAPKGSDLRDYNLDFGPGILAEDAPTGPRQEKDFTYKTEMAKDFRPQLVLELATFLVKMASIADQEFHRQGVPGPQKRASTASTLVQPVIRGAWRELAEQRARRGRQVFRFRIGPGKDGLYHDEFLNPRDYSDVLASYKKAHKLFRIADGVMGLWENVPVTDHNESNRNPTDVYELPPDKVQHLATTRYPFLKKTDSRRQLAEILMRILDSGLDCNNPHLRRAEVEITLFRTDPEVLLKTNSSMQEFVAAGREPANSLGAVVYYFLDAFPPPEEIAWMRASTNTSTPAAKSTSAKNVEADHSSSPAARAKAFGGAGAPTPWPGGPALHDPTPGQGPAPPVAQAPAAALTREMRNGTARTDGTSKQGRGGMKVSQQQSDAEQAVTETHVHLMAVLAVVLAVSALVVAGFLNSLCRSADSERREAVSERKRVRRDVFEQRQRARKERKRRERDRKVAERLRLQAIVMNRVEKAVAATGPGRGPRNIVPAAKAAAANDQEGLQVLEEVPPIEVENKAVGGTMGQPRAAARSTSRTTVKPLGRALSRDDAVPAQAGSSSRVVKPLGGGRARPGSKGRKMLTDNYVLTIQPPQISSSQEPAARRREKLKMPPDVDLPVAPPPLNMKSDFSLRNIPTADKKHHGPRRGVVSAAKTTTSSSLSAAASRRSKSTEDILILLPKNKQLQLSGLAARPTSFVAPRPHEGWEEMQALMGPEFAKEMRGYLDYAFGNPHPISPPEQMSFPATAASSGHEEKNSERTNDQEIIGTPPTTTGSNSVLMNVPGSGTLTSYKSRSSSVFGGSSLLPAAPQNSSVDVVVETSRLEDDDQLRAPVLGPQAASTSSAHEVLSDQPHQHDFIIIRSQQLLPKTGAASAGRRGPRRPKPVARARDEVEEEVEVWNL